MSMDLVAPSFLRALASDLLLDRLSTREGSDYLCRAADEIERLRASPTPPTTEGRAREAAQTILAAESMRGTGAFFEAVEHHALTVARALLSSPRVEQERAL